MSIQHWRKKKIQDIRLQGNKHLEVFYSSSAWWCLVTVAPSWTQENVPESALHNVCHNSVSQSLFSPASQQTQRSCHVLLSWRTHYKLDSLTSWCQFCPRIKPSALLVSQCYRSLNGSCSSLTQITIFKLSIKNNFPLQLQSQNPFWELAV